MTTFNTIGKKIDHAPFSLTCGPLSQVGIFSHLIKTTTITGVLEPSEILPLGKVDNFLTIILMFDPSEKDIKDDESPTITLVDQIALITLQISKICFLGTKLKEVNLANSSNRKVVYNLIYS